MKPQHLADKSEWGELLHTALRKCCDSTPTTIAYQAICGMSQGWSHYLAHLEKTAKTADSSHPIYEEIKRASLRWSYLDAPRCDNEFAIILHCAFELFDDNDWQGYVEFLVGD